MTAHSEGATEADRFFITRAIELATRGWGTTDPNPMVGALIVEDGVIVGEGWHERTGEAHAEIAALRALGRRPKESAVLYVSLEPCSTVGRTGACTRAILDAGIRKVVVGAVDPNPDHAGRGLQLLREAGVAVVDGVLADACADLNLIFNHWVVEQTPFLAAKMAMTLDGKFAAASGHSKWITGPPAREDVMRWRRYFPAIAVGANTVLADDPSLTSRRDGDVWCPRRFVLDRQLRTAGEVAASAHLPKLYTDSFRAKTVVLCGPAAPDSKRRRLEAQGVELWEVPEQAGHFDWTVFRRRCAAKGITGVYIETGPTLATALIEQRRVDYLFVYQAPKFIGDTASVGIGSPRETRSMSEAIQLTDVRHTILGEDVLVRGRLPREEPGIKTGAI